MTAPLPYVATVKNVREVMLVGSAAWEPWAERLAREDRIPFRREAGGRAEVRILACGSRFKGLSFRECSVSVSVSDTSNAQLCVLLTQAYNSRRFFAWSERTFFGTPYAFARVALQAEGAAGFSVETDRPLLQAQMGQPRTDTDVAHRELTARLDIPARAGKPPRLYYAFLSGVIHGSPFDRDEDQFSVHPPHADHPLQALLDSDFQPLRWLVGVDGVHARTKSVRRT